jgi:hypothetical protein
MKKGVERAVAILLLVICSGAAVGQPSQKLDERTRSNYTQMARSFEHDGRHEQAAAYYRLIVLDDPPTSSAIAVPDGIICSSIDSTNGKT